MMSLRLDNATTHTYTALYNNDEDSPYYPDIISLYAFYNQNNGVTLTSNNTTNIQFVTFDQDGNETVDNDGVMNYSQNSNWNPDANNGAGAMVNSNLFAIKINAAGSITIATANNTYTVTICFLDPASTSASAGSNPTTVCGYLPIGQFARPNSMGWGTIYTDNTNVYASTKTPKFTSGIMSTGVSLGMLGGYVQYEFKDAIGNDADNPYGIDFIVYGNAFNGNPEAGAVMVYGRIDGTNTKGWFNLAGSRHYQSGTIKNEDITYIKITGTDDELALNSDFTAAGIYYSKDFVKPASDSQALVDAKISAANWTSITTTTGWWPEIGSNENYEQVWKMHRPDTTTLDRTGIDSDVGGVYWYTSGTAQVIRYEGVTEVVDSNITNDYYFGYADVRANGTNYGVAVNPYATAPAAAVGGDGFDLSWAVDANGEPVNLTDVHFVRVYSAVLFNAGVFGETSTAVCGVYVASGEGTGQTTSVQGANLSVTWENNGSVSNPALASAITSANTFNVDAETEITVTFSSSGNYIFVNEETGTGSASLNLTLEDGEEQIIRVIAKDSTTGLPYIGFMKLVGVRP
jgi:hypothetical protein